MSDKATKILVAAKATVAEMGWGQGNEILGGKVICAGLAITRQRSDSGVKPIFEAMDRFALAAGILGGDQPIAISTWNDAPDRTLEEVNAAFDKAIAA